MHIIPTVTGLEINQINSCWCDCVLTLGRFFTSSGKPIGLLMLIYICIRYCIRNESRNRKLNWKQQICWQQLLFRNWAQWVVADNRGIDDIDLKSICISENINCWSNYASCAAFPGLSFHLQCSIQKARIEFDWIAVHVHQLHNNF